MTAEEAWEKFEKERFPDGCGTPIEVVNEVRRAFFSGWAANELSGLIVIDKSKYISTSCGHSLAVLKMDSKNLRWSCIDCNKL